MAENEPTEVRDRIPGEVNTDYKSPKQKTSYKLLIVLAILAAAVIVLTLV